MKAAMNGGLNCSVLDGWWCEGYDPAHGWAIGDDQVDDDDEAQDARDAESLYRVLREEIIPCYYDRGAEGFPQDWAGRMKRAIAWLSPRFSTTRMVREYTERFYQGSSRGVVSGT